MHSMYSTKSIDVAARRSKTEGSLILSEWGNDHFTKLRPFQLSNKCEKKKKEKNREEKISYLAIYKISFVPRKKKERGMCAFEDWLCFSTRTLFPFFNFYYFLLIP